MNVKDKMISSIQRKVALTDKDGTGEITRGKIEVARKAVDQGCIPQYGPKSFFRTVLPSNILFLAAVLLAYRRHIGSIYD